MKVAPRELRLAIRSTGGVTSALALPLKLTRRIPGGRIWVGSVLMDWPELRRFAEAIGPDGRARLLRILEASEEERAGVIGRLHLRDDGALLEELLIELEEKEWARQAAIEELRARQEGS